MPFAEEDLTFQSGFISTNADQVRKSTIAAESFSKIINFIPNASLFLDEQNTQMLYKQSGSSLNEIYANFLNFSKVADEPISKENEEKIARFRSLLSKTITEEDILTGKPRQRVVEER